MAPTHYVRNHTESVSQLTHSNVRPGDSKTRPPSSRALPGSSTGRRTSFSRRPMRSSLRRTNTGMRPDPSSSLPGDSKVRPAGSKPRPLRFGGLPLDPPSRAADFPAQPSGYSVHPRQGKGRLTSCGSEKTLCPASAGNVEAAPREWQPEWVGSSVPGATFYKPSRFKTAGAFFFSPERSLGQHLIP